MMMMMMIKSNLCIKGVGTYASRTFATSFVVTSRYLPPPFCVICHPYFRTIETPKLIFDFFQIIFKFEYQTIMLEVVMDLVVNEVIDKEVDKEMTKVVEEINKK